jgi:hypothetical protein
MPGTEFIIQNLILATTMTQLSWFMYVFKRCIKGEQYYWKKVSSGILLHVALVRTNVSEEPSASFIRVTGLQVYS